MGSDQSLDSSGNSFSRQTNTSGNYKSNALVSINSPREPRTQPFNGIWSIYYPETITPIPRSRCFSVYDKVNDISVVGYGVDGNGNELNDIWCFQYATRSWTKLNIDTSSISPRQGSTAVLVGRLIYVFGGKSGSTFLSDFHIIDLEQMRIFRPTKEYKEAPPARIGQAMGYHSGNIAIWGGNNETLLDDLWLYNTQEDEWHFIGASIKGRTDTSFVSNDSAFYIACSSNLDDMIRFDWNTKTIDDLSVKGNMPPINMTGGMFVSVGQYIFLVGGHLDQNIRCSIVRGYDTIRKWWFVFHVMPDEETTTIADGAVDDNGIFMVPRISFGVAAYREVAREIVVMFGRPVTEPPPLFVLSISEPLAYLHLQSDMLSALNVSE